MENLKIRDVVICLDERSIVNQFDTIFEIVHISEHGDNVIAKGKNTGKACGDKPSVFRKATEEEINSLVKPYKRNRHK